MCAAARAATPAAAVAAVRPRAPSATTCVLPCVAGSGAAAKAATVEELADSSAEPVLRAMLNPLAGGPVRLEASAPEPPRESQCPILTAPRLRRLVDITAAVASVAVALATAAPELRRAATTAPAEPAAAAAEAGSKRVAPASPSGSIDPARLRQSGEPSRLGRTAALCAGA